MKLTKFLGAVILAVSVTAAAALPVSASEYNVTITEASLQAAGFTIGKNVKINEENKQITLPAGGNVATNDIITVSDDNAIIFKPTYNGTLTVHFTAAKGRAGIIPHGMQGTHKESGESFIRDNNDLNAFTGKAHEGCTNPDSVNNSAGYAELCLNAGEEYYIALKAAIKNTNTAIIDSITYTYEGEDKTIAVEPITVDGNTTSAGIKFTRSDNLDNVWDYSIYEQVKDFVGTVNFDVTMSDVPTDVTVTGTSYAE